MTDETKGDGMTLAEMREGIKRLIALVASDGSFAGGAQKEVDRIFNAHLAAQSAMRVDVTNDMFDRAYEAYGDHYTAEVLSSGVGSDNHGQALMAALQAAIGGKE